MEVLCEQTRNSIIMTQVRTDASKRYGLPEVPGKLEDVKKSSREGAYKRLHKLGTMPYDIREIIYHIGSLTQRELKEKLESYEYTVPQGDTAGDGGTLVVLEEVTGEITREGTKNDTVITWIGERGEGVGSTDDLLSGSLNEKKTTKSAKADLSDLEIKSANNKWKTDSNDDVSHLPTHESIDVISYATISKNQKWWKAVVIYDHYGEDRVAVYLWRKTDSDGWKRKQKYILRSSEDWEQDRQVIGEAVERMN